MRYRIVFDAERIGKIFQRITHEIVEPAVGQRSLMPVKYENVACRSFKNNSRVNGEIAFGTMRVLQKQIVVADRFQEH